MMVKVYKGRTTFIYEIEADGDGINEISKAINLWRGRKLEVTIRLR